MGSIRMARHCALPVGILLLTAGSCKQSGVPPIQHPVETDQETSSSRAAEASRPERLRLTSGITGITDRELDVEFPGATEWEDVDEPAPAARFLAPGGDLLGTWGRYNGDDSTVLTVTRARDGLLDIAFETGGHLGGWTLTRRGRYQDGVLVLNLPVREYLPQEYRRLYRVRVLEREYLVSSSACSELERLESALQENSDPWLLGFVVFSKQADRKNGAP